MPESVLPSIRDLDALARRAEMRQRQLAALDRLHVRGLHLREVVHEQEFCEVIVDAGALQVLAGADELLAAPSASRPISSCTAARADQAPHQSFHDVIEAVTSSKSVSATPLATKRGAQWCDRG